MFGAAYGSLLAWFAFRTAGGGFGTYVLLGLFSSPFPVFVTPLGLFVAIPFLWALVAFLLSLAASRGVRRVLVGLMVLHYGLLPPLLLDGKMCGDWNNFAKVWQLAWGSTVLVMGIVFYLAGQVALWWLLIRAMRENWNERLPRLQWFCVWIGAGIVIILFVVMPLSRLWQMHQRWQEDDAAVRAIEELGGEVHGDNRLAVPLLARLLLRRKSNPVWAWVHLENTSISDSDLDRVGRLARVRQIDRLYLQNTAVSDEGLRRLKDWPAITALDLSGTRITNDGLRNLADMKGLYELHLNDTQVSDAGLVHLRRLHRLDSLELRNTKVTGTGLKYLAECHIGDLDLAGTPIQDGELTNLRAMKQLGYLHLENTNVTDAGLQSLQDMDDLSADIFVMNTRVTRQGAAALEKANKFVTVYLRKPGSKP